MTPVGQHRREGRPRDDDVQPVGCSFDGIRRALGLVSTLVPIGLFAAGPDGQCLYVSQSLIDALGVDVRRRSDRPFRLVLNDDSEGRLLLLDSEGVQLAAAEGSDTARTSLEVRVMPLVEDGVVTCYVGVVAESDGSGEAVKLLHPSEGLFETLVRRSPEVMTVLNADGTWRYSNAAAWRLLGYQADFDPVDGILTMIHPDDVIMASEVIARIRSGEALTPDPIEIRARSADGSWLYLETVVENLLDEPSVNGFLVRSRDVTAQSKTRRGLMATNERLVEVDRAKAELLAEIRHELRTPLTSILSFSELLKEGIGQEEPDETAELVEVIRRNADRLLRLVDDLVLLESVDTSSMSLRWGEVDVVSLVTTSAASFAPVARARSIAFASEVADGPVAPGDEDRLGQVLDIVLSNALKFTSANGHVSIETSYADGLWHIVVADDGIGVPANEQSELFERFYRATNARAARISGSGLGLSVAQAVMTLHGGSIALSSSEAEGTTVELTIPVDRRASIVGTDVPGERLDHREH